MSNSSDLYSYRPSASQDEEPHFLSMRGRIPLFLFWERLLLICTVTLALNLFIELILSTRRELFHLTIFEIQIDFLLMMQYVTILIAAYTVIVQSVKRSHDCNISGIFGILNPLIFIKRGTRGKNNYGLDPIPKNKITYFDEFEDSKKFKELQFKKNGSLSFITFFVSTVLLGFVTIQYYNSDKLSSHDIPIFGLFSKLFVKSDNVELVPDSFETCTIGDMIWMSRNLRVDTFVNGDVIPEAKTKNEWVRAAKDGNPSWCYYENDSRNDSLYGKLYNWYAVNDPRGLAPSGWRIATNRDWERAANYLGGVNQAGKMMKNNIGWKFDDNSNNLSTFKATPGGYRKANDGAFIRLGMYGYWWTADSKSKKNAVNRGMEYNKNLLNEGSYSKGGGFSVRCLKDGGNN
ncbi:MAG: FISUMP domain-containing protein [Chitinophagaceae bacterium]